MSRTCIRPVRLRGHPVFEGFTVIELLLVVVMIGTLSAISLPLLGQALDSARVTRAIGDIRGIASDVTAYQVSHGGQPDSLSQIGYAQHRDPWGNPYQYLKFDAGGRGGGAPGAARKDKFLVPINSSFDLYSMGKDGQSSPPLTAQPSRDDVVMANDGGYVGLAKDY